MTGLDWMYGRDLPLLSLTFARGLTARELLERMGADDSLALRSQEDFDDEFGDLLYAEDSYVVSAGRHGEWAWAWEHDSWQCVADDRLVCDVSMGTQALVLHANEKPMVEFRYAENGHLITGINTVMGLHPDHYTGCDPHRFIPAMRALDAAPGNGDYGPLGPRGLFFRLAEDLGVGLPHADLTTNPVLSAELQPRPDIDARPPESAAP
ncbi:DUF6461 domain-containing protein [Streptomyces sp. NBC_01750]|uniref:DUF6461 domain-containing protein n=1 Tax=Streptomyces sp. NBC_01750 TaxID=2975928 RepID=UPI002DD88ED0|nr:DUF6461 domain-containing protein [Streptomyces sp. NBC_01750]WSD30611.1 DUF6461 domain-containing protein [Streptomyces sp. NBC_01750]